MPKPRTSPKADGADFDKALGALSIDDLRALVRDVMLELDERAYSRVLGALIKRAARGGAKWALPAVSDDEVAAVFAFCAAAVRIGWADPSEVDEHLRRGASAFLRKDYANAQRIFEALLRPLGNCDIDVGQHELLEEVLGTDMHECAAQFLVCAYMNSSPSERAAALYTAIDELYGIAQFREPVCELEKAAVEPLPEFESFLTQWHALVLRQAKAGQGEDFDDDKAGWLHEVVRRLGGPEGLAELARSTRRARDLCAWCRSVVETGDWKHALLAYEEAAEIVADDFARGEMLDRAAFAAKRLRRRDLPARFERAWRAAPSMARLRRWLGSTSSKAALRTRAEEALAACPKHASRQRAFLHVLQADFESAAMLLRGAPGLGWSDPEHPGHLLFELFPDLLGQKRKTTSSGLKRLLINTPS